MEEDGILIFGTPLADEILPAGSKLVFTGAGADLIDAVTSGGGNRLYGGSNGDEILVSQGDRSFGGYGNDTLDAAAGNGNNRLYGGEGDDELIGVSNERLFGGEGNDTLDGTLGSNNRAYGGEGDDLLLGGRGDRLVGGPGDDRLFAGLGDSTLTGGLGADEFWIASAELPDAVNIITDFESGSDVIGVGGLTEIEYFEELQLVQVGEHTSIRIGEVEVALLLETTATALSAADFNLPPAPPAPIVLEDVSELLDGFVRDSNIDLAQGEGLGGAAWLDYDNDEDLDLFLPNGRGGASALFRNNGDETFTDVALEAGVAYEGGSTGVAVGDLDNNGYVDIFLTGTGGIVFGEHSPTVLFLNNGDGTFTDVTATAGVPGAETSAAAALGDINNDGWLDIFIASPGHIDLLANEGFPPETFGPTAFHPNTLYLSNGVDENGDLTFTDISESAGIDDAMGACVAGFSDYDNDGWLDIYVGNCNFAEGPTPLPTPFNLYRNNGPDENGNITFTDVATEAGIDRLGIWMSFAPGDYDNDGDIDFFAFFATNGGIARQEPHAFYRNNGDGTFTDIAADLGVANLQFSWGATLKDFNNDGYLDLYFAGAFPLFGVPGNPGWLLFNDGQSGFNQASIEDSGGDLGRRFTSGVAAGDFNGDGFEDVVVVTDTLYNLQSGELLDLGTPVLYRNSGNENNWLTLRLVGTESNRSAIGAKVELVSGELEQVREVLAGSSFASSENPWPSFGLARNEAATVRVTWPSGLVESYDIDRVNQIVTLTEGEGNS